MKKKDMFELPVAVLMPPEHAEKFERFLQMLKESKSNGAQAIITTPESLGDTYEEMLTNLRLIAQAKISLELVL